MPTLTFTPQWVKWVKPPEKGQVDYFDTWKPTERGVSFVLRVSYGGAKVWYLIYRQQGKWRRHKLGAYPALRLSDARDEAARRAEDIVEEREAARRAGRHPRFAELAADYVEHYARPHKRTWLRDRQILDKELVPVFGARPFDDISRWEMIERVKHIAATRPVWANRTLEVVRKMYNWSRNERKYAALEYNPFSGIPKPASERPRTRTLTPGELRRLWDAYGEMGTVGVAFRLMLVTGQRVGQVVAMRRQDIAGHWWTTQAGARSGVRRVYLGDMALREIKRLEAPGPWLFPSPGGSTHLRHLGKAHERVRAATGIDFRPDDLRRTVLKGVERLGVAASALTAAAPLSEAGAHPLAEERARHALQSWERELRKVLVGTAPPPLQLAIQA